MDVNGVRANRRTWEMIAASFDATRRTPWTPVVEFLQGFRPGQRVLDAGMGNGRHAEAAVRHGLHVVGLDLSHALLKRGRRRAPSSMAIQGVLERLPFRTASFDGAVCAAVLHHIRGRPNRLEAWRELRRVTRPSGRLLVTVWARDPDREWGLPAPGAEPADADLTWTQHGLNVARFVHFFLPEELAQEATEAGWRTARTWTQRLGTSEASVNHLAILES